MLAYFLAKTMLNEQTIRQLVWWITGQITVSKQIDSNCKSTYSATIDNFPCNSLHL